MISRRATWVFGLAQVAAVAVLGQDLGSGPANHGLVGPSAPIAPRTFGTSHDSLVRVGSMEFQPFDSTATYNDTGNTSLSLSRYPTSNTGLQAFVHVPSGALITGLELDYCDTNVGEDVGLLGYVADFTGNITHTIAGPASTGASGGCSSVFADVSADNVTIDNDLNELVLYATFGAFDGTNSISGAIVHYKLQVSAAPGTPTFGDVPVSDTGFQYIEALSASGITGGCGGGNFCPDANVTRRQMAIFLAKALGLQWQ